MESLEKEILFLVDFGQQSFLSHIGVKHCTWYEMRSFYSLYRAEIKTRYGLEKGEFTRYYKSCRGR